MLMVVRNTREIFDPGLKSFMPNRASAWGM